MATKWNAFTASTRIINTTYFIYCTTNGWWGNWGNCTKCWNTYKLLGKELDLCPHILKTFYNYHCYRKINLQWKLYMVFGALFSSWRYAWTTHRLGVINLPLCLKGAYWGGLVAVGKNIPLEMRRKRAWVATEWNETMGWGNEMELTGCLCVDIFVRGLQPISEM